MVENLENNMTNEELNIFMTKVLLPIVEDGCWAWNGGMSGDGYGSFCFRGICRKAHVLSYEHFNGPLNGLHCLHSCNHSWCVNPKHLYAGTARQNGRDRARKCGKENGKLTLAQISEIRRRAFSGESQPQLAKEFGISYHTLANCVYRRYKNDPYNRKELTQ